MQKEKLQKNKGISLVETIIYVAIFSMIVTTFVSFSSSMTTSRLHNQKVLEVNDQGGRVMKMITQSIRNADVVNSPTIGNNASSLSLNMYQIGVSPTVFFLDAGVLYITEAGGTQVALTNNKVIVSDLNFSNFSNSSTGDVIKISFTISSAIGGVSGTAYTYTFNSSAQIRK